MKKFLSLVLALVMTMSLVTISAGAKDFDDNGDIDYKEAVDVISALGIVDGYSDGSFRPDGSLTRGAAAKIICNLILGPTTASALSASTAPFKDVPTTNVFAGYITYCAQQGIISGYGDGTFRPSGTLTGNAFMKMLLGALGYDSSIEGYTGANWQVNVVKQAVGIGLKDGNDDFVGSRTVTRQEACLYAFNMINATMVEYDQKSTVVVGDVTINNTSTRDEVANSNRDDNTIKQDGKMQFAEKYFTKLVADPDTDDFGRPSTTWVYDGDDVGTYANDADATLVVADADKSLADLMTDSDYLNYDDDEVLNSANVYFNGMDVKGDSDYEDNASAKDLAGKGDILEVYENDDGDVTDIIIRSYTYAMIDTVDNDLSTSQENKGASVALDLVDVDGDALGNGTYYDDYDDSEDVLNGYSSSYTEGTAIAVALGADDAILDSYVMESVTGTPSTARAVETYSYDNALTNYYSGSGVKNGTITVGGDRYTYAAQFTGLVAGADVDFDEEYTVYLTAEGYALAVTGDSVMSLNDVYYIVGLYAENTHGSTYYYAQAISVTDGVEHELRLDYSGASAASSVQSAFGASGTPSASNYVAIGELFKLDEDDNKYTVVNPGTAWTGNSTYTAVNAATLTDDVTSGDSVIRYNSTRSYIQDNTFFIGAEKTGNDLKVTTATGMMSVDKNSSTGLKVTLIMDGKDAVFVIYAATDLNGATNKDDVVYMTGDANTRNTKDTYEVDLMFLADMELSEDVTIDDDQSKQGFYTYSVSDNVYDLDRSADAITAVNTEDGYAEFVVLSEGRNNTASSVTSGSIYNDADAAISDTLFTAVGFDAVSIADATVIDTRSSGARSRDEYSNEITSPARLINALDKGWVVADLYLEDGDIIFVAVRDCKDSASAAADATITASDVSATIGNKTTVTPSITNGTLDSVSVANTGVATAVVNGSNIEVTGVAAGTTTMRIYAKGTNGRTVSKTVNITVTAAPVELTLNKTEVEVSEGTTGTTANTDLVTARMSGGYVMSAVSNNTSVATVTCTGGTEGSSEVVVYTVTGVAQGTATITITAVDGTGAVKTETVEVTVLDSDTTAVFSTDVTTSAGYTESKTDEASGTITIELSAGAVPASGDELTVTATPNGDGAKASGTVTLTYKSDSSEWVVKGGSSDKITVTAADGSTSVYTVSTTVNTAS